MVMDGLEAVRRRNRLNAPGTSAGSDGPSAERARPPVRSVFGCRPRVTGSKRKADSDAADDPLAGCWEELPSDTEVAMAVLTKEFPLTGGAIPVILKTQIYSLVSDRTAVDRDLERLNSEFKVRIFKLGTARDDYAVVEFDRYIQYLDTVRQRDPDHRRVFDRFEEAVVRGCRDVSISRARLCQLLFADWPGAAQEEEITRLVKASVLVQGADTGMFLFTIPHIGSVLKSLVKGRAEMLAILNRTKYKELFVKELEKKRLRYSTLGIKFHMRDLVACGLIETVATTSGPLVRLVKS